MAKLKTLKDIERYRGEFDRVLDEAIKWVKIREKQIDKLEGEGYGRQYLTELMDFANIIEEDLK